MNKKEIKQKVKELIQIAKDDDDIECPCCKLGETTIELSDDLWFDLVTNSGRAQTEGGFIISQTQKGMVEDIWFETLGELLNIVVAYKDFKNGLFPLAGIGYSSYQSKWIHIDRDIKCDNTSVEIHSDDHNDKKYTTIQISINEFEIMAEIARALLIHYYNIEDILGL
jgi:hypothetical protein